MAPVLTVNFLIHLMMTLRKKFETTLLEMGLCGLHVVHGTFKNDHKNAVWNVNSVLRSFYKLVYDSPARRPDY